MHLILGFLLLLQKFLHHPDWHSKQYLNHLRADLDRLPKIQLVCQASLTVASPLELTTA
jgi:hypothetical protein